MTLERWQQVKQVLHQAWERHPGERCAFLDRACANDPELRSEVESLLECDENADEFLVAPAIHIARDLIESDDVDALVSDGITEHLSKRRIGPYRILREIGHGGMGTVYLAERADGQYRKCVAIKCVGAHLVAGEVLRRFRRERQVEAALEHPNIARLLDGGTTGDGLPYLVMEYVEGTPIDTWCDSHKLSVRDRLRLFQQVCAAVQYAHEKQVIHRDLKPGNILVTPNGSTKLLDFGIAKVLNADLFAEVMETTAGPGPMTPEYASPEQVRGERVGPASDIYSLGMLLYYLLTGQLPYKLRDGDLRKMMQDICDREPVKPSAATLSLASELRGESPRGLRRQLAGDLDNIVLKALRKEPERRYTSVAQLSEDLDRFLKDLSVRARKESWAYHSRKFLKRNRIATWAAAMSAALVLALVAGLWRFTSPSAGAVTSRSIAVLPLENLSGDREQEYFADGMTDALISDLAKIRTLRVISRTSVMSYKGAHRRLPEIARSLGVQTIAEGSVLRTGTRLRIAIRLVDAPKDHPLWTGSYEGEMQNVLGLQEQVAEAIAGEIHVTLTASDQARKSRDRRVNLGAYDAYLKGRHQYFTGYTEESVQKAIAWFRQALALDPSYAPAYAGMADCYWGLSSVYYPPTEMMPHAKWAALKALELDDTQGEAHAVLGVVRSGYEFNRAEAGKEFQRAIELKPSDAQVHLLYGIYLAEVSRFEEAISELDTAQKLDPVSPFVNAYVGLPLLFARRYDQAIQRMRPLVEMNPKDHEALAFLALAYEQKGDWVKAIPAMEKANELDKDQDGLAQLGHMYAVSGRTREARRVLHELKQMLGRRYVSAYNIAVLYAGLGERDEAFRWLQKVEEDRSEWFGAVNVDPRLDSLHSDPRWPGILHSVGLAQ